MFLLSAFTVSLNMVLVNLYRIGGPILIVFGTVSCLLNLMVFGKKTLRKSPCSVFLLAFNATNLVYIYTSLLSVVMSSGYSIQLNLVHLVICRLIVYDALIVDVLSPSFLIGASIDRLLITSSHARIRHRSTLRSAYLSIAGITLFWFIFHAYPLTSINIFPMAPGLPICYFASNAIVNWIAYYSLTVKGIIIPCAMAISGFLTVRQIRSTTRPSTITKQRRLIRHRDCQFIRITLTNIGVYFLCNLMSISDAVYEQITEDYSKSVDRIEIEYTFRMFGIFLSAFSFCTNFYSNILISKTFREESKTIFRRRCC